MMSGHYRAVVVVAAILPQLYIRFGYDGLGLNRL